MTLKVLFATDHIHFPQGGGGGERNTHELCLNIRGRSIEPAVLCSLAADNSWLSYSNRLRRVLPPRRRFPRDTRCGYPVFRGWDKDVSEVLQRFRPAVGIVQSTHPGDLLRSFAAAGVPAAAYIHEVEEIDHLREYAGKVPFFANSNFTAGRLHDRCGIEAKVILPLIDAAYYRTERQPRNVLFVNTVPRKGLEIAFRIAESRPDIPFDFLRSWILSVEQREAMKRRVAAAGNITIHEPTRDMRPLYARARILLAPSLWEEAWGRVATEAHINAIPVLASNRGGLPDAVGPGGIIVDAEAPIEAWLAALSKLWDEPAEYAGYAQAAENYARRPEIQPNTITDTFSAYIRDLA